MLTGRNRNTNSNRNSSIFTTYAQTIRLSQPEMNVLQATSTFEDENDFVCLDRRQTSSFVTFDDNKCTTTKTITAKINHISVISFQPFFNKNVSHVTPGRQIGPDSTSLKSWRGPEVGWIPNHFLFSPVSIPRPSTLIAPPLQFQPFPFLYTSFPIPLNFSSRRFDRNALSLSPLY